MMLRRKMILLPGLATLLGCVVVDRITDILGWRAEVVVVGWMTLTRVRKIPWIRHLIVVIVRMRWGGWMRQMVMIVVIRLRQSLAVRDGMMLLVLRLLLEVVGKVLIITVSVRRKMLVCVGNRMLIMISVGDYRRHFGSGASAAGSRRKLLRRDGRALNLRPSEAGTSALVI